MKKYLFLVATILLTMSMSVSAQNNRRNANNKRSEVIRMTPAERADLMTKQLDLTADQAAQVLALCEKQDAERLEQVKENRDQRATGQADREARRKEMMDLRKKEVEKQNAELEKVIGKEKLEKWNELRKDVRETNREGRTEGRGGNRSNKSNR